MKNGQLFNYLERKNKINCKKKDEPANGNNMKQKTINKAR